MKYILLFLLMMSFVSASCIDINSASLEELKKFNGVGDVKAQAIIDTRPFDSVDDLIKVYGIGPVTLENIKTKGLACVDGKVEEGEEIEEEVLEEVKEIVRESETKEIVLSPEPPKIISLNENVDSELVYESKDSKIMNWLPYVFCVFLIGLVGILFWERF